MLAMRTAALNRVIDASPFGHSPKLGILVSRQSGWPG
jgi:hypothetical protein